MDAYYVNINAQSTGEHEVHKEGCDYFPRLPKFLGNFSNCQDAVKEAMKYYADVDGCAYCIPDCHTR
ncbi:MAG: hypothetical protein PWQ55_570 [Chloroflexota bacterium]|nr:hypothetical protein [Chloroflexota bacterium]